MVKPLHPQAHFWLEVAPPADRSELGIRLARETVAIYKRDFGVTEWRDAYAYLQPWNERHGKPFSDHELRELSMLEPAPRPERKKRFKPDLTNTLYGDISKL